MEEVKKEEGKYVPEQLEEQSMFSFAEIYKMFILNWPWIFLSVVFFTGLAYAYVTYTPPVYQARANMLIKDEDSKRSSRDVLQGAANLGIMSNSIGFENEMQILGSRSLAEEAVKDLKLYVSYTRKSHNIIKRVLYKTQPVTVDIDAEHLAQLKNPISLVIKKQGKGIHVSGSYTLVVGEEKNLEFRSIEKTINTLPISISTKVGILTFSKNIGHDMEDDVEELVTINTIEASAALYAGMLSISPSSKTTTIANLVFTDQSPERAIDYLTDLALVYNRQANVDKNEVARSTEKFINARLEKIDTELGATEGAIEDFKVRNNLVEVQANAQMNMQNANQYDQELVGMETQIMLLNSVASLVETTANKYQTLPSNVGLEDATASSLINSYNQIVLERNRMLQTASEQNDAVITLTQQLNELNMSIKAALKSAKENLQIKRDALSAQLSRFSSGVQQTPQQEREMGQIGRQREVQIALYTMLLQKREENSISLAATADKGRLIDSPTFAGQIAPKRSMILAAGFGIGLAVPFLLMFLINFFRYKIEGHEDVESLTTLPIIADVAVASNRAKKKADIVVHENKNNMMEEIFRTMRTNIQFMLKEHEKVIMFTSSTSGEGKTFCASNLAICFALLGKRVALVGLDIRKPRLAELFEIPDKRHGITNLLVKDNPTWEDVRDEILPSGVNDNLDLLMAGPIPPNPAELIVREQLDMVFNHLKENYDYVVVDTAPIGLVTDSIHLARLVDITVVLCRADYTPKDSIRMINGLASEKKLTNPAIVINGIDMTKKKYGYAYGYGKYGRYGRYGRYGSYGKYGKNYGSYNSYSTYSTYGNYSSSHYGVKNDDSIKN